MRLPLLVSLAGGACTKVDWHGLSYDKVYHYALNLQGTEELAVQKLAKLRADRKSNVLFLSILKKGRIYCFHTFVTINDAVKREEIADSTFSRFFASCSIKFPDYGRHCSG